MLGMRDRVRRDGIKTTAVIIDRPNWADFGANWYSVTLRRKGRQITVPFGMGSALTGDPTAEDVINCLVSDAAGYENARGFEDWAGEYGLDSDSRRAERTYRQVETQTRKLRTFLGDDYDAYLWETESL